jgi:hypothetical protein
MTKLLNKNRPVQMESLPMYRAANFGVKPIYSVVDIIAQITSIINLPTGANTMIRTLVQTYHSEREMRREIAKREKRGFVVQSVTRNGQGYSFVKTAALGLVFLPLALLGKKKDIFQVVYQYEGQIVFGRVVPGR